MKVFMNKRERPILFGLTEKIFVGELLKNNKQC